jgi:predicted RNA-binding Zn-ribbon protein involved in translation (DUF1610 family)
VFGTRCEECGEVRWSILGRSDASAHACPICGGAMVEERRHPGRRARALKERRDEAAPVVPGARPRIKLG